MFCTFNADRASCHFRDISGRVPYRFEIINAVKRRPQIGARTDGEPRSGGPWRGEGRFRRGVAAFYRLDRALSYALIAHFVYGALGS